MISYFLIKREGISTTLKLDQNISSIHSVIKVKYLQIFRLIYDTPSSCTMNNVKLSINTASKNACKFVITTVISVCLFIFCLIYCPESLLLGSFAYHITAHIFYLCCIKLDDYIDKINKLSLDIGINNYMKLSHWPWQFQI